MARCAQPVGCRAGVYRFTLPLCVLAGAHRAARSRDHPDGGCAAAGRASVSATAGNCLSSGPTRCGRRCGAGPDGDPGRLRGLVLFRHPDLYRWYLQGLAGLGRSPGCSTVGHRLAAGGGAFVAAGAACPAASALQPGTTLPYGLRRSPARAIARPIPPAGLGCVRGTGPAGLWGAGGDPAACPLGRDHRHGLDTLCRLGAQQLALVGADCVAGGVGGAGIGLPSPAAAGLLAPQRHPIGRAGLCSAGCGGGGGPSAAAGVGAADLAGPAGFSLDHRNRPGSGLGLPGAFLCRGIAIGAKRLRANGPLFR